MTTDGDDDTTGTKRSGRRLVSRRHLVGAVGAGLAAGTLGKPGQAGAAVGTMQYGAINAAGDGLTQLTSDTGDEAETGLTLAVRNEGRGGTLVLHNRDPSDWTASLTNLWSGVGGGLAVSAGSRGVLAIVDGGDSAEGYAVRAQSTGDGAGVDAYSGGGVGVRARSGKGQPLVIVPTPNLFDPLEHAAETGTIVLDTFGKLSLCAVGGEHPTWRTIFHPSGGAFHPINPVRPYDSRETNARLSSGQSRLIEVGTGRDENGQYHNLLVPYGITAVAFNLTVTQTASSGYLSICAGNKTTATSIVNWTSANQTIANASVIPVDSTRKVKITCGGLGSTHFILDISGYYH